MIGTLSTFIPCINCGEKYLAQVKPPVESVCSHCKTRQIPFATESHRAFVVDKQAEIFKQDPDYCKKLSPKFIKLRNGSRVRYDPTKHC